MSRYRTLILFIFIGIILAGLLLIHRTWAIWGLSRYVLVYLVVSDLAIAVFSVSRLKYSFGRFEFHRSTVTSAPHPALLPKEPRTGEYHLC